MRTPRRVPILILTAALAAAACSSDGAETSVSGDPAPPDAPAPAAPAPDAPAGDPVTVTLLTHDSFAISDDVLAAFTDQTGIEVELLPRGDAGQLVNESILTAGDPIGDVLFGIDNTFLSRALDADLFLPHEADGLDRVRPELLLDDEFRVTPIDTGDVCLNYDIAALDELDLEPPTSLDDLVDPAYAGTVVVQNPATSSPGLAFLLATIDAYGPDGWQDWWRQLRAQDVTVDSGWESAYYGTFTRYGGDRPIIVSYASSPPAEVIFADEPLDEAPTGVVEDSCYRQIEFAGVLAGTDDEAAARALVDFMLTDAFQEDVPANMFVYPAVAGAAVPEEFDRYGVQPSDPYLLPADEVAEHREDWIEEWTDIVLR